MFSLTDGRKEGKKKEDLSSKECLFGIKNKVCRYSREPWRFDGTACVTRDIWYVQSLGKSLGETSKTQPK